MTPGDLGQKVKQKYPGVYDKYPDEVVGQRWLVKNPQYQQMMDQGLGQTTMDAVGDMFSKPASAIKSVATDPVTMAKVLPAAAGLAGAVSPIPGGATLGTVGGRQLSNLALKGLGHPEDIPSIPRQVGEASLAALGDVAAIPAIKGKIFGGQIGKAEDAAGIVTRGATKAVTPGNVGQTLNDLESQIDAGTISTPQGARDAKEVVDQIYKNPHIYEKSPGIQVQSARISGKVQGLLNDLTPGRAGPAAALAKSQTIPDVIQGGWKAIPTPVKLMLGVGGTAGVGAATADALRSLFGGVGSR